MNSKVKETLLNVLYILFLPFGLIFGGIAICMPLIIIGGIMWAIAHWRITLPILLCILIVYYCITKILERIEEQKREKEFEKQKQKTREFCKNHPEVDKPINYTIVPFENYVKNKSKWCKYGKGLVCQGVNSQPFVVIFGIVRKQSYSRGFHSPESYNIPIFDVSPICKTDYLVNLKDSEIISIVTEDRKEHLYINPMLFSKEDTIAIMKFEQFNSEEAKKGFPFRVEIKEAKDILDKADETTLQKINGRWGINCIKYDGQITNFIPLLNNLKIESLPNNKWELTDKQAKVYIYHFAGYERNEKYVPGNIFADKSQPAFIWKETTRTYLDSGIEFDKDSDLTIPIGFESTERSYKNDYQKEGFNLQYDTDRLGFEIKLFGYEEELWEERFLEQQEMRKKQIENKNNTTQKNTKYEKQDENQQIVIYLHNGLHLVLAPPGCGKTRVLAERVTNAIDNGIKAEDMLCLTFTNRAAREMKERIDKRVESEDIERLFVGNVHHFCSSLLRENKVIAQKTTIIDDEEKNVVISEIIKNKYGISPTNVDDYYYFQHYLYQRDNYYPAEFIVKPEMEKYLEDERYLRVAREYLSYKKRYDLIDFEDLLLYGYDYLVNHQNDVKRYSWIQVDEVQDLNRLQLTIIEMVTAHEASCVVYLGDEQQAIYSFMGAKLETLKYLKDQCQGNIHHFLGNYRSPKYLLNVYNKYAEVNLHVDKDLLPQAQGKNADMAMPQNDLLIESCERREGFNKWDYCALDMAVDRAIAYPDGRTAILTYSNKDSDKISERLERKGVEHFKIAGTDFLWTKEVKLIFSHLNVFTQPENIMSWARILQGIGVCKKMEEAHQLISEANNASLRGNDLLDDARHQMIKKFVYDCAQEYVIFDTETTGLDVNQDDIVEIAAIRIRNGVIDAELDIMLYTEKTIPPMLGDTKNPLPEEYAKREKLNRKEGLLSFLDWVGGLPILAHNAKYDYQILDANLKRDCGIYDLDKRWERVHDSLAISRVIEPNLHSYRLKDLLTTFALQGKNSHLAIDDVKATKSLVDYCHRKASMVFVLQNDFFAKYKDMITRTKELYGELYSHTKSLLQQKPADGERNLLASEMEYAYHYFQNKGMIDELPKMKYLMPFISEDFISDTDLSLQQLLDKYMVEIMTLRESDLCESKSMKDKVKIYVSTIHRAKGLEFENVVVFDVRDGLFPFFEWNQILNRTFDPAERKLANEGIQEDARELYVAISRAKKRLCIQYPRNNTGYGKNGWYEWSAKESPFMACIKHLFITLDK